MNTDLPRGAARGWWIRASLLGLLFMGLALPFTTPAASISQTASEVGQSLTDTARGAVKAVERRDPRALGADDIAAWLIIGALVGMAAGLLLTSRGRGYGPWRNWLLGVAGAFVGGVLLDAFRLNLHWGSVTLRTDQALAALVAAVGLVLGGRLLSALWNRFRPRKSSGSTEAPKNR